MLKIGRTNPLMAQFPWCCGWAGLSSLLSGFTLFHYRCAYQRCDFLLAFSPAVEPPQLVLLCGSVACVRWLDLAAELLRRRLTLCFSCPPDSVGHVIHFQLLLVSFSFSFKCLCAARQTTQSTCKCIVTGTSFIRKKKRLKHNSLQLCPGTLFFFISCSQEFPSAAWHDYVT